MQHSGKKAKWNDESILRGRFSFLCNPSKDIFSSTSQSDVHFCTQCQKKVYEVDTKDAFEFHAQQRNCVLVRTSCDVSLVAQPDTPKELFILVETDLPFTQGPFSFQDSRNIVIGSGSFAHVRIPSRYGVQKIHVQICLKEDKILLLKMPDTEIKVQREGSSEAEYLKDSSIVLAERDRFFFKGSSDWIPCSFSIQDAVDPSEVFLGGQITIEPVEVSFFSEPLQYIKNLFSKKKR